MIIGFEKQTAEVTVEEMEIATSWAAAFKARLQKGKGPITAAKIAVLYKDRTGKEVSGARARKIINYIRTSGMAPNLLANSNGYYMSDDPQDINAYICSLDQRIRAITAVREALIDQQKQPEPDTQQKIEI